MQLLVIILNKTEYLSQMLNCMLERNICGATVLDSTGMIKVISEQSIEPPSIFGSLREFINPSRESSKTVFMVLPDEKIEIAKSVVKEITGGFDKPNTGIMFTIPISYAEGIKMV
ncbi:MAG TPA: hypothetical protein PK705_06525 [Clostridia bacterium]|nr:hypothetical protein [Clostridia bacterium]MDD4502717.1 hypothetical protein [Clostridia bacterium]NLV34990.1 hypothetical protein [Clostridiaceae bacterium]HQM96642.1 hypothetical protein [Clostridia bacterium]